MTTLRDVVVAQQKQQATREPVREFFPAVLIFVDSTDGDAKALGFPDFVWASAFNQPESHFKVLNRATPPTVGLQVKIGFPEKPPFQRQVLGVYDEIHTTTNYDEDAGGALNSQPHHQSHQYPSEASPGTDPVLIFQPAVQMLKTTGNNTDLTITIEALPSYRYQDTFKAFNGTTVDLTASVPGVAGTVRNVLIYLDATTNVIQTVDGTAVPVAAITVPQPVLPDLGISSALVQLTNGQTAITTATHVTDTREFLDPRAQDSPLTATAAGQILISNDGVTLELGIPLVDPNGDIYTDSTTGHIVVI